MLAAWWGIAASDSFGTDEQVILWDINITGPLISTFLGGKEPQLPLAAQGVEEDVQGKKWGGKRQESFSINERSFNMLFIVLFGIQEDPRRGGSKTYFG